MELQVVVSHHVGEGVLQTQQMLLAHEPPLQTSVLFFTHTMETH